MTDLLRRSEVCQCTHNFLCWMETAFVLAAVMVLDLIRDREIIVNKAETSERFSVYRYFFHASQRDMFFQSLVASKRKGG